MRIILPKTLCEIDPTFGPLLFLAGPIRGGDDWQTKCCIEISKRTTNFYAALPCRYEEDHFLIPFQMSGKENHFDRQLSWERHYLELAATKGCIIFWLPCESKVNPRVGSDPYAMDTRGELGEWRGRMVFDSRLRVVVGAEADFPGLSQIQRNFSQALDMNFPIYSTLAETVSAALAKAK